MKPISRVAIKTYFRDTLSKSAVVDIIEKSHTNHLHAPQMLRDYVPMLTIDNDIKGFKSQAAGFTIGVNSVHLAQWILADESEAKAVVRHEIAHLEQHYVNGDCPPHGKEFTSALKIVSPKTWRKDRHWHDNAQIAEARKECKKKPQNIHLT